MTKTELLQLLTELGLHPSRRLGQNFLVDPNLMDCLVRTAAPQPGETILEIGPGTGILTRHLLAAGSRVVAVEIDHRLAGHLRRTIGEHPNFILIEDDACKVDYNQLLAGAVFRCIANLPYAVSAIVICRLLELPVPPEELFLLLQKEMADRLAAVPSTPDYGALTVQVQMDYSVQLLRRIPPQVFFPMPEVDSAYLRLHRLEVSISAAERILCRELVRLGFSQRRKMMMKLLTARYSRPRLEAAFRKLNLPADIRAEAVPVKHFLALTRLLGQD